ncbi:hypothetical protein CPAR01_01774 [Colletotrichum paranaense]|uniref:AA1-like domain-containing protein n=1 Tax=Colletotrichum paranaense TaxID=1914294 RepID=A0ABQ9T8U6_9PEZI|nr:uncharacterized protein CPAR01_01774 [Colletotrichum paranaense]KAK1547807.1 hypothetical protein CPAR01_01774 [Colletotrichum paranaense]
MHLSPFFQLIVAALITPGMALPTEVKETGQAAISHAPPTPMADSISAKEFDGTMTTVSTSTRCIHVTTTYHEEIWTGNLATFSFQRDPRQNLDTSTDLYHYECGIDILSLPKQSSDKAKDSDDTLGTNSTILSSRQNICHK